MNLTKRQVQIVELLAQGLTAEEVADKLSRAIPTVRRHVQLAYERVGARNTPHLVAISISRGFINIAPICIAAVLAICIAVGGTHDTARRGGRLVRQHRRPTEVQIHA